MPKKETTLEEVQKNSVELEEKLFDSIGELLKIEKNNGNEYSAHELYIAISCIKKSMEMLIERKFGKEVLKEYQNSFILVDTLSKKGTC